MSWTKVSKVTTPTWTEDSKVATPSWTKNSKVTTPTWNKVEGFMLAEDLTEILQETTGYIFYEGY